MNTPTWTVQHAHQLVELLAILNRRELPDPQGGTSQLTKTGTFPVSPGPQPPGAPAPPSPVDVPLELLSTREAVRTFRRDLVARAGAACRVLQRSAAEAPVWSAASSATRRVICVRD